MSFAPTDLTLGGWWDPFDAASITSSSGAVSQLNDKSGNARHLTQATSGKQPITGTRTIGACNALDYDGVDDSIRVTGVTQAQPVTVFVVCQTDDTTGTSRQMFGNDDPSPTLFQNVQTWRSYAGAESLSGVFLDTSPHIVTGVFDNAGTPSLWVDGVLKSTSSPGAGAWSAKTIAVGSDSTGAVGLFDGLIGEVIFAIGSLSTVNLDLAHGYLGHKWSISVPQPNPNLPPPALWVNRSPLQSVGS